MTIQEKLADCSRKGTALLAANFYNFETLSGILQAASEMNRPVILQLSESSIHYLGVHTAASMARAALKSYEVEGWLHLDHGSSAEMVRRCLDEGFDSVMIDASESTLNENIRKTSEVVKIAESYHANVEAELGYVAKLNQVQQINQYTQPEEARSFVEATGVNALAIAIGSAHGFYKETPNLQLDLLSSIREATPVSLVLHGSSGIPDDQLREAIRRGISKVNLATETKNIFMKTLQEILHRNEEIDLRKVFPKATSAVKDLIAQKIRTVSLDYKKGIATSLVFILTWLGTMIPAKAQPEDLDMLLLRDYRPKSIYAVPVTKIAKAKYPVIDMHSHAYAHSQEALEEWVRTMDRVGIEKTIILTYQTGQKFDSIYQVYAQYPGRFEVWCGFDYTGYDSEPDWAKNAVAELERCYKVGARGIGELGDKGLGEIYSKPVRGYGMHIDDPRMKPLLEKCAELKMPVSIHVAEPMWMYQPMDSTNDGLMNGYKWRVDMSKPGILNHGQLIGTLENAVRENPETTFIACHFANTAYDLQILGRLLEKYSNLYADIAARFGETAPIPRYMNAFYEKYQDKLLYGTDMGGEESMYQLTFRILETSDEHFYEIDRFNYHWPCNGFGLSTKVLKKVYHSNAARILKRK